MSINKCVYYVFTAEQQFYIVSCVVFLTIRVMKPNVYLFYESRKLQLNLIDSIRLTVALHIKY